jgi:hypothetical protein
VIAAARLLAALALGLVPALAPAPAFVPMRAPGPAPAPVQASVADDGAPAERRIDLAAAPWTRDGVAAEAQATGTPPAAHLPFPQRGVRWATRFRTAGADTARLLLDWSPGPDGLLFEIVLDGVRLTPARDGWRPGARAVTTDLGAAWLGDGDHLLEFVAREEAPAAALHLHALRLASP